MERFPKLRMQADLFTRIDDIIEINADFEYRTLTVLQILMMKIIRMIMDIRISLTMNVKMLS